MLAPHPPQPRASVVDVQKYQRKVLRLQQWVRAGVGPGARTTGEVELLEETVKKLRKQITEQQEVIKRHEETMADLNHKLMLASRSLDETELHKLHVLRHSMAGVVQSYARSALAIVATSKLRHVRLMNDHVARRIQCAWRQALARRERDWRQFQQYKKDGLLLEVPVLDGGWCYLRFVHGARCVEAWRERKRQLVARHTGVVININKGTLTYSMPTGDTLQCDFVQRDFLLHLVRQLAEAGVRFTFILERAVLAAAPDGTLRCHDDTITVFLQDRALGKALINGNVISCTPYQNDALAVVTEGCCTPHVKCTNGHTRWWFVKLPHLGCTTKGTFAIYRNTELLGNNFQFVSQVVPGTVVRCAGTTKEINVEVPAEFVSYLKSFCFTSRVPFREMIELEDCRIGFGVLDKLLIQTPESGEYTPYDYILYNEYTGRFAVGRDWEETELKVKYPTKVFGYFREMHPEVQVYHSSIATDNMGTVYLEITNGGLLLTVVDSGAVMDVPSITYNLCSGGLEFGSLQLVPCSHEKNVWVSVQHVLDAHGAYVPLGMLLEDSAGGAWEIRERRDTATMEVVHGDDVREMSRLYFDNATDCFLLQPLDVTCPPAEYVAIPLHDNIELYCKAATTFLTKKGIPCELNSFMDEKGSLVTLKSHLFVGANKVCPITMCHISLFDLDYNPGQVPDPGSVEMQDVYVRLCNPNAISFIVQHSLGLGVQAVIYLDILMSTNIAEKETPLTEPLSPQWEVSSTTFTSKAPKVSLLISPEKVLQLQQATTRTEVTKVLLVDCDLVVTSRANGIEHSATFHVVPFKQPVIAAVLSRFPELPGTSVQIIKHAAQTGGAQDVVTP